MSYTTEKDAYGNTVLFQDGQRIATGTESAINAQIPKQAPVQPAVSPQTGTTPPTSRYTDPNAALFAEGGLFGDTTPLTPDEISKQREEGRSRVQSQIDAIEEVAQRNYAEIAQRSKQASGRTRARLSATGQIGSGDEGRVFEETERPFTEERRLVEKEKQATIAGIYGKVDENIRELIKEDRVTTRENAAMKLDRISKLSEKALASMNELAAIGADLTPEKRQEFMELTGYDEKTFDQLYKSKKITKAKNILNKDKPLISDDGSTATYIEQKDDGTFAPITIDLPESAKEKGVDSTVSRDDGIYVFYKDGTWERVGEPKAQFTPAQIAKQNKDATALKAVGDAAKARANEVKTLISELEQDSSIKNSVIGFRGVRGLIGTPEAQAYLNKVRRLQALLAIDSIKNFKGFGAMSDREFSTANAAASSINIDSDKGKITGTPDAFNNELARIKRSMDLIVSDQGEVTGDAGGNTSEEDELRALGYSDEQIEQIKNAQ